MINNEWDILDLYFKDHKYPFTGHHLDSYRNFVKVKIPEIIKSNNPITMIKMDDSNKNLIVKVDIYIGGLNGDNICVDRPIAFENGTPKLITPNDARMRNLTYETHLFTNVLVRITNDKGAVKDVEFKNIAIGGIPIMLHSDICLLKNNGSDILKLMGECPYDTGGYFIIDGKEKVIIAQENIVTNKLFTNKITDDPNGFSYKGIILCVAEKGSVKPSKIQIFYVDTPIKSDGVYRDEKIKVQYNNKKYNYGSILVSVPSFKEKIPLFILFRALGIESDKDICDAVMYIKDFKIYNRAIRADDVILCKNNSILDMPLWYKLYDNSTKNSGKTELIDYPDIFSKMSIDTGDYTLKTFLLNYEEIEDTEVGFKKHSEPAELTNLLDIYSRLPFIFDMGRSTIYENLGFDLYNSINPNYINDRYQYKPIYNSNPKMYKMFHSILNTDVTKVILTIQYDKHLITSPGIVYLIGNKYIVLKCPEIEEHLFGSLSYSKYSLGLAKFRVDNVGINSERLVITKLPIREFHPIGKLSRISLRFETNRGTLYDFKGVNHNIVFAIYYYEPKQNKFPEGSILNPEYKMNYIDYKYYQEEIEGDSEDETEEYSRDNINDYKKKEIDYSNEGIKLRQYNEHYVNKDDGDVDEDDDDN